MKIDDIFKEILLYDEYNKREGYSASQLSRPCLQLRLSDQYPELKQDDITKLLSSRIGTAFHKHAELALKDKYLITVEETLTEDFEDVTISGTSDIYDEETDTIYDHKTMQHWKANWLWDKDHEKHQEAINDFVIQMSCLRWLKSKQEYYNPKTKILVWVVDYKKPYVRKDGTSKPTAPQYFAVDIPSMKPEDFEDWLRKKLHDVKNQPDTKCPGCPDTWVYDYCAYKEVCPVLNKSF